MKEFRLVRGAALDKGCKREVNEDALGFYEPDPLQEPGKAAKGNIYVLADGMGGHVGGREASQMAVNLLIHHYYLAPSADIETSLRYAIEQTHQAILLRTAQDPSMVGMGSTVVAAVLRGEELCVANLGDSRAYLLQGNQIQKLSQDHSWVAEEVAAGHLTPQQARQHQYRNVVTRSLGANKPPNPHISLRQLQAGDTIALCSDGVHGVLNDQTIWEAVATATPQAGAEQLVVLANAAGGPDNISALVVRVADMNNSRRKAAMATRWPKLAIGAAAVITLAMFVLMVRSCIDTFGDWIGPEPDHTPAAGGGPTLPVHPTETIAPVVATPQQTPESGPHPLPGKWRPVGAQAGKVVYDVKSGNTLSGIAEFYCHPPQTRIECSEQILVDNPQCFNWGDRDSIIAGCQLTLALPDYRLLLVGEVGHVEEDHFILAVDSAVYTVNRPSSLPQRGDVVRVFGPPEAPYEEGRGENIDQVYFLQRWEQGFDDVVPARGLPPCATGEWNWIYTQARPLVWRLVENEGPREQLERHESELVLLRACHKGGEEPGLLYVESVYRRAEDGRYEWLGSDEGGWDR